VFTNTTSYHPSRKVKERAGGRLIVCLDCGFEMPYSWNEIRSSRQAKAARSHEQQPEEVVAV
jgi:hypothetical protein